jgi:hypothetical protein
MPGERDPIEIVHAGAAEGPVGRRKAGRFDDMGVEPKAGRKPQNGPGVLWNIRLEQGDTHGQRALRSAAMGRFGRPDVYGGNLI